MIPITVVLIILICISYFYLNYHRRRPKTINHVFPGPRTWPIIGNAFCFFRRSPDEILNIITKWTEDYPSPFRCWIGNKLFIFVNDPDQIKTILQSSHCLNKNILYKFFEPLLGEGIFTAPELKWRLQRRLISPTFSNNMLLRYFDVFVEQSLILTNTLENIGLNSEIIFFEHISERTLDTACVTLMGVKIKPSLINQFLEASIRTAAGNSRLTNLFFYSDFIFNLSSNGREFRKNINLMHSFIDEVIQQADTLNRFNIKNKSKKNRTFYDIIMDSSHKENFAQNDFTKMLHNNVLFMLIAASETSAITLNFVVFILANFSEIQEKVYQELREIYGTKTPTSTPIKYEDLQRMNYLENVIKETMRLFPVAPLIGRKLTEDLNIGNIILPKGTDVILQLMAAHRKEKFWPNPLVFDPDRFLPENTGKSNSFYMPFSLGSRNCMGIKYAMISMKVFLSTLVQTFVFKIDKSIQIDEIKLH
ncbi:cytochrome P450 4C1-like [Cataglyphis hispanica]|uniref:cytochrome P450 4C1-like n=1 Tax=Cataglyphis hispanica TaxID=1086592 RepID=UPI00217FAAE2|nr:cytochrome P450 4C1-like [Cataglyphis hispanica]